MRRVYEGQVLLTLFYAHNHTIVLVADTAVAQRLPHKRTLGGENQLTQTGFRFLFQRVFHILFVIQRNTHCRQLFVVADYLNDITRKQPCVATRDIDTALATQDAAHVNTKTAADTQLVQSLSAPQGILRNLKLADMDIPIQQMSLVQRTFLAIYLCHDITRTQILDKHTLQFDAAMLQLSRKHHQNDGYQGDGGNQRIGES